MLHVCTHTLPAHFTAVPSSRMYMMYQAIHVHKLLHYPSTTLVVLALVQVRSTSTTKAVDKIEVVVCL